MPRTTLPKAAALLASTLVVPFAAARSADYPSPVEGTHVIRDFHFASAEALPELRMHYYTLGKPQRDERGLVLNAVLILHGTGGDAGQFLRRGAPLFAAELFGAGQPLDATRYFIAIPDNIGHGRSSKPSDGLRAKFPRYGYRDMIAFVSIRAGVMATIKRNRTVYAPQKKCCI